VVRLTPLLLLLGGCLVDETQLCAQSESGRALCEDWTSADGTDRLDLSALEDCEPPLDEDATCRRTCLADITSVETCAEAAACLRGCAIAAEVRPPTPPTPEREPRRPSR
jgi:hypothetical protein